VDNPSEMGEMALTFITRNWRAKPLLSYRVIVELIGGNPKIRPAAEDCLFSGARGAGDADLGSVRNQQL
jgi:hypothetical protein